MGLTIVSRKKWGAKAPSKRDKIRWIGAKRSIRVHHTASEAPGKDAPVSREFRFMQETQQFHMGTRGYADIAYSYVIMPSGRVYVGRGFGVKGAHTLDHNSDVGICFAGTYTQRIPSDEAVAAFWQLKRHLRRRGVRGLGAVPHRATFSTACPGAKVVKALGL